MKITIFADGSGNIVGSFRPTSGGGDSPSTLRMSIADRHEYDVEIAEDLLQPELVHELHSEYRIDATGPNPKLIKVLRNL